jgi:hypothetical protein
MRFNFVKSKTSRVFIIVLIIIFGTVGFFIARQYAKSNVDYICTVTTSLDDKCVVPPDGWGPYTPVPGSPGVTQSVGIGTKEVTLVQTYHSRRTSCGAGSVVTGKGKSGGATGWYGFQSNVVGAACQLIRYGTITMGSPGGCPQGKELNKSGDCVAPEADDLCYNISGIQNPTPDGMFSDNIYNCYNLFAVVDLCTNDNIFPDKQTSVPTGYVRSENGTCTPWQPGVVSKIPVSFQCSVDNTAWNDCSRVILPSINYPVYLRPADNLSGDAINWTIEDNASTPLGAGKSIGSFASNNNIQNTVVGNPTPVMKLTFGAGTSFSKLVELAYTGVINGISSEGATTTKINIIILKNSSTNEI